MLLTIFNILLAGNPEVGEPCKRVRPVKEPDLIYDFIVVGCKLWKALKSIVYRAFIKQLLSGIYAKFYSYVSRLAGAGGAAVAGRLSEVKDWKVLLVEAGPDEPAGAEIPSNLLLYLGN